MMHQRPGERPTPPDRIFNIHTPAVRPPSQMDIYIENGVAFVKRLGKQLILTLCASLFRAAAEWLLKGGDEKAKSTLMDNMRNDGSSNTNSSPYRSSASTSSYNQEPTYYNRYRQSNGSETFPGFQ